jgi:hypothetical protein
VGKVEQMSQRCRPEGRRYTKRLKSGFGEILRLHPSVRKGGARRGPRFSGSSLRMTHLTGEAHPVGRLSPEDLASGRKRKKMGMDDGDKR